MENKLEKEPWVFESKNRESGMMNGYSEFLELRRMVLDAIGKMDMHELHKSYEGTFELTVGYPSYFDETPDGKRDEPDYCKIVLHCYVLGPSRHYEWHGDSVKQAVLRCKADVTKWIDDLHLDD